MKKGIFKILMALVILMLAISCGKKNDTINIVFLPNESNDSLKASREEFAKIIEKATGKKANILTEKTVLEGLKNSEDLDIQEILKSKVAYAFNGGLLWNFMRHCPQG